MLVKADRERLLALPLLVNCYSRLERFRECLTLQTRISWKEGFVRVQNVALLAGFLAAKTAVWINTQARGRPSNGVYDFGKR